MQDLQNTRKIDLLWPLWEKTDFTDQRYSIGALFSDDGTVLDSSPGMAAFESGIVPGVQIVEVNGAKFSISALERAVADSNQGHSIEFVVANGDFTSAAKLNYNGGAKYPVLQRQVSRADMLGQILSPHARNKR
jgi:predicted metalloprotease with PDZ domain